VPAVHDLSLYLLELLENSVRAEATRVSVGFSADRASDLLRLTVDDDGSGLKIDPVEVLDPFYTTKKDKKTGLGLSLLKADAEAAGGRLTIGPSPALGGVRVEAEMVLSHIDRPPIGDVASSILVMEATNPDIDFTVSLDGDQFDPPVPNAGLGQVRGTLTQTIARLDQQETIDTEHTTTEYTATQSPPRKAPLKNRGEEVRSMTVDTENRAGTCAGCEEASEEELLARLEEVIASYKDKPGALIPVLQHAQAIFGYLPEVALKRVAVGLKKPYSEVAGVVSFYSFFSTVPRGKHLIRVCLGTACYVRGGLQVLEAIKDKLGIDVGETTEDRLFSLEVARCFGACGLTPAVSIDDEVHRRVRAARVGQMLAKYYEQEEVVEHVAG
jgi:NADH:ubiquinone oxidoreductase subunit E